jgi:hypothetical protein
MVRPPRVALFGWSLGFLAAGLWGLGQPANHRIASALLVPAGICTALLLILVLSDLVRHRDRHHWVDLEDVDGPEFIPVPRATRPTATTATSDASPDAVADDVPAASEAAAESAALAAARAAEEAATAARIAALEARLAAEQEDLDEMIHALAEADAALLTQGERVTLTPEEVASAAELEPVLRQQVLDALVELVGDGDILPELERLTAPGT